MTEYLRPSSLAEAVRMRAEFPSYTLLAGGTDVMVSQRGRPALPGMIDLFGLAELAFVRREADLVVIGAATTFSALRESELLHSQFPSLWQCASEVGAAQIQARATLGGNVATASPVGDSLPVLLALGARVRLASARAERVMAFCDFITGYRRTALAADELITAFELPLLPAGSRQYWRKVGTRRAQSISKVSVAGYAEQDGGRIRVCRLAMGAVADRPIRLTAVEALLTGVAPCVELGDAAALAVGQAITPIDDVRSSAAYRRLVAQNLTRRFVTSLGSAAAPESR